MNRVSTWTSGHAAGFPLRRDATATPKSGCSSEMEGKASFPFAFHSPCTNFAPVAEQTLKEKTARGLLWGGINNGAQQVLNLVFGIVLARILSVDDYGTVGMLTIFSLIATSLQESGFISALNRKPNVTHADYNAVFWFNVAAGLVLYLLLGLTAPLIARFFNKPVLEPLSRLYFLNFLISSMAIAPRSMLFRNMRVKQTAQMTIAALVVSGATGIALALCGFAFWGLAIQNVTYCTCITLLSWYYARWRPSLHIDLRPLREMFGFSSKLLVTNVFTHVNNNVFSVFFGKLYGTTLVGHFNQANKWTTLGSTTITGMLQGVTQPVFARIDDVERKRRIFRKMLRFTAFVSFPAMLGLALVAREFITITITAKWLPAAQLMQLLCVAGAVIPVTQYYANFVISQGKSDAFLLNTVAQCVLQLAALFALCRVGVEAMVVAYVVINVLWWPVWHVRVRRLLGLGFGRALLDVLPFAAAAVAAMAAAWGAAHMLTNAWASLAVKVGVAAAVYVGLLRMAHAAVLTESLAFLTSLVRKKKN